MKGSRDLLPLQQRQVSIGAGVVGQPHRRDPAVLRPPSIPGLASDPDDQTGLDCAHSGRQQPPVLRLKFQPPLPAPQPHVHTPSTSRSVATNSRTHAEQVGQSSTGSDTLALTATTAAASAGAPRPAPWPPVPPNAPCNAMVAGPHASVGPLCRRGRTLH